MDFRGVWIFFLMIWVGNCLFGQDLIKIHAHNDYLNDRPLYDALSAGANSIEIDIVFDGSELKVSHDQTNLEAKPTIEALYFDSLIQHISQNDIYIWLLIDLKTTDQGTLDLLHQKILDRSDYFLSREDQPRSKPLQVILSGNLNRAQIAKNSRYKFFFLDGRPSDLGMGYDNKLMPLISTRFDRRVNKKGPYKIKGSNKKLISKLNRKVEGEGRELRFWNTPDEPKVWSTLSRLGVDVIGTDDVHKLSTFIKEL